MAENLPLYLPGGKAVSDSSNPSMNSHSAMNDPHMGRKLQDSLRSQENIDVMGYRGGAGSANGGQQQQSRWDSDLNFSRSSGSSHRCPPDPIDMTVGSGRPQLYPLSNCAGDQAGGVPSPVHHFHRMSPTVHGLSGSSSGSKNKQYYKDHRSETSLLMQAVKNRNVDEIQRLVNKGVDVNAVEGGLTPLHLAAKYGDVTMIEMLLFHGADRTKRDNLGCRPEFYGKQKSISVDELFQNIQQMISDKKKLPMHNIPLLPGADTMTRGAQIPFPNMGYLYRSPYSPLNHVIPNQKTIFDVNHASGSYNVHPNSSMDRIRSEMLGYNNRHTHSPGYGQPTYDSRFPPNFENMMHPLHRQSVPKSHVPEPMLPVFDVKKSKNQYEAAASLYPQQKLMPGSDSVFRQYGKGDASHGRSESQKSSKDKDASSDRRMAHIDLKSSPFNIDHLAKSDTPSLNSSRSIPKATEASPKCVYPNQPSSNFSSTNILSGGIDASRIHSPFSTDFFRHELAFAANVSTHNVKMQAAHFPYYPKGDGRYPNIGLHPSQISSFPYGNHELNSRSKEQSSGIHPLLPEQKHHNHSMKMHKGNFVSPDNNLHNHFKADAVKSSSVKAGSHTPIKNGLAPSAASNSVCLLKPTVEQAHKPMPHSRIEEIDLTKDTYRQLEKVPLPIADNELAKQSFENRKEIPAEAKEKKAEKSESVTFSPSKSQTKKGVCQDESPLKSRKLTHESSHTFGGEDSSGPQLQTQAGLVCSSSPCKTAFQEKDRNAQKLSALKHPADTSLKEKEVHLEMPCDKKAKKRKMEEGTNESGPEKKNRAESTDLDSFSADANRKQSSDETGKREKRPRKSETEDDYLYWDGVYDDFTSSDPDNDDSSDEDFCCPIDKPQTTSKRNNSVAKSRPKRQLALKQGDSFNGSSDHSFVENFSDFDLSSPSQKNHHQGKASKTSKKRNKVRQATTHKLKGRKCRKISSESASSNSNNDETQKILSKKKFAAKKDKLLRKAERKGRGKWKNENLKRSFNAMQRNLYSKQGTKSRQLHKLTRGGRKIKRKNMDKHSPKVKSDMENESKEERPSPPPGISKTLMELYTGSKPDPLQPVSDKTQTSDLFGDELTEKEAQVLSKVLDSDKQAETVSNASNQTGRVSETSIVASETAGSEVKTPVTKPKKKRGRKPKSLLKTESDNVQTDLKCNTVTSQNHGKIGIHKKLKQKQKLKQDKLRSEGDVNNCRVSALVKPEMNHDPQSSAVDLSHSNLKAESAHLINPQPSTPLIKKEPCQTNTFEGPDSRSCSPLPSTSNFHDRGFLSSRSRASTPLSVLKDRTLHSSPLPPNFKKLTCNSAIGETLLHKAARHGYLENLQHYLERGFDVNSKDNAGYTALHEACVRGNLKTARLLLEFGANVNLNSTDGTRPVHDAIEYDHLEMTRLLLSCGADPLLSKFSGRSVPHMIRSPAMDKFMCAYIKELKPLTKEVLGDSHLDWNLTPSAIYDTDGDTQRGFEVTANAPDDENDDITFQFDIFDEAPLTSFFVQPSATTSRSNYYLLADLLQRHNCKRGDFLLQFPVDIKTMKLDSLLAETSTNSISNKCQYIREVIGDSDAIVELVPVDKIHCSGQSSFEIFSDEKVEKLLKTAKKKKPTRQVTKNATSLQDALPKTESDSDKASCSYTVADAMECVRPLVKQSPVKFKSTISEKDASQIAIPKPCQTPVSSYHLESEGSHLEVNGMNTKQNKLQTSAENWTSYSKSPQNSAVQADPSNLSQLKRTEIDKANLQQPFTPRTLHTHSALHNTSLENGFC